MNSLKCMRTERRAQSIAAENAIASIDLGPVRHARRAATMRHPEGASVTRNVGAVTGIGAMANDTKAGRPLTALAKKRLFPDSVASAPDAGSRIFGVWILTISIHQRNCGQSIGNTLLAFASNYGRARLEICKSYARIAIASRHGGIGGDKIACQRIENAQRQGKLFEDAPVKPVQGALV